MRRHWQLVCSAFSFCWWAYYGRLSTDEEPAETEKTPSADLAGREKRRASASWPGALRAVRAWLEPWVMLWRYWKAFSEMPRHRS
jgi:hypothetical protein